MEVRGANTFPLLNRLPDLNLVAMTILSISFLSVGFIDIFPFLLGINKVRWRLCCTSNACKHVESHFYRYTRVFVLDIGMLIRSPWVLVRSPRGGYPRFLAL